MLVTTSTGCGRRRSRARRRWPRSKTGLFYLNFGGRKDKTITTKITTNGRCIICSAVK